MTLHEAYTKKYVLSELAKSNAKTVWDLGFGYGEYGLLMRFIVPTMET